LYYDIILVRDPPNALPMLGVEEVVQPILVAQTAWYDNLDTIIYYSISVYFHFKQTSWSVKLTSSIF